MVETGRSFVIPFIFRRLTCLSALLVVAGASLGTIPAHAQHVTNSGASRSAASDQASPEEPKGVPEWGIASDELEPDPAIRFGVLDNGMRYAVRSHVRGSGEISMRLLINAGALEEEEDEQGAAHFVEHMAFNGSTNIPEGELVPMLERLGLAFGPDTNAETGISFYRMRENMSPRFRTLLLALGGASLCLLLLTCANLANLLLARAASRERELAVRAALGAGRERLMRQLVTESVALAVLGGAGGIGVAIVWFALPDKNSENP